MSGGLCSFGEKPLFTFSGSCRQPAFPAWWTSFPHSDSLLPFPFFGILVTAVYLPQQPPNPHLHHVTKSPLPLNIIPSQVLGIRVWRLRRPLLYGPQSSRWPQKIHIHPHAGHAHPSPAFPQVLIHHIINSESKISLRHHPLRGSRFHHGNPMWVRAWAWSWGQISRPVPAKLGRKLPHFEVQWGSRPAPCGALLWALGSALQGHTSALGRPSLSSFS